MEIKSKIIKNIEKKIIITGDYNNTFIDEFTNIIKKILPFYKICYKNDISKNIEQRMEKLKEMSLVVVILTKKLLQDKSCREYFDLEYAINNEIPLLPIAIEEGILEIFNESINRYHCINYNKTTFYSDLERYVNQYFDPYMPIMDFNEDCREVRVFISYRKEDKNQLKNFLNKLYSNKQLIRVQYWYDKSLIPGENFEKRIEIELENSEFVILLVTNSIFETGNYVLHIEYPLAVKLEKKIIPVILDNIDLDLLNKLYPHTEKPVFLNDYELLEECITNIVKNKGINLNEDFSRKEFQIFGLRYLSGDRGQDNIQIGIELLKNAAILGDSRSYKELGVLYFYGNFVEKNISIAVEYFKKSFEIVFEDLIDNVKKDSSPIILYNYCSAAGNLAREIMWTKFNLNENTDEILYYLEKYLYICSELEKIGIKSVKLNKGSGYKLLGCISFRNELYKEALIHFNNCEEYYEILIKGNNLYAFINYSKLCYMKAKTYEKLGSDVLLYSIQNYLQSLEIIKKINIDYNFKSEICELMYEVINDFILLLDTEAKYTLNQIEFKKIYIYLIELLENSINNGCMDKSIFLNLSKLFYSMYHLDEEIEIEYLIKSLDLINYVLSFESNSKYIRFKKEIEFKISIYPFRFWL